MRNKLFFLASLLVASPVHGAPPENANPAYADYFKSLKLRDGNGNYTGYCCSIADCRPVRSRHVNGYWEVFVDELTFGAGKGTPNDWVRVPKDIDAVSDMADPVRPAEGVACWYQGSLRCFDLPQVRM